MSENIYLFIYSFIYLFIYLFIHLFILVVPVLLNGETLNWKLFENTKGLVHFVASTMYQYTGFPRSPTRIYNVPVVEAINLLGSRSASV